MTAEAQGPKVTVAILVDEQVGRIVDRRAPTYTFSDVLDAILAAVEEVSLGGSREAMDVLAASLDAQKVEFVSQERVKQYEAEHDLVSDARLVLAVAAEIANNQEAMRVLDTAYGSGKSVRLTMTLGAALRDAVGSKLPISQGLGKLTREKVQEHLGMPTNEQVRDAAHLGVRGDE